MGVPDDETLRGLIPNCFAHIFGVLQTDEDPTKKFLVRCSYLEIYNEDVFDLLVEQKKKRRARKARRKRRQEQRRLRRRTDTGHCPEYPGDGEADAFRNKQQKNRVNRNECRI